MTSRPQVVRDWPRGAVSHAKKSRSPPFFGLLALSTR